MFVSSGKCAVLVCAVISGWWSAVESACVCLVLASLNRFGDANTDT